MKASDILGETGIKEIVSQGRSQNKSNDEIKALIKITALQKQKQQQNKSTVKEALKDSIYDNDGIVGDITRAVTTNAIRLVDFADGASEQIGFDLVPSHITKVGNEVINTFEEKKQKNSREDITPKRLEELNALEQKSANAKGITENLSAGVEQMVDVVSHPSEWTTQGVVEMFTDPLNALSFGTGGLVSKFGTTLFKKALIGGGAGMAEGTIVNSASEYLIAKGQDKSDSEATKIALQSAGGGAVAGGFFGAGGAMVGGKKPAPKLKDTSAKDILDNDLLKTDIKASDITNISQDDMVEIDTRIKKVVPKKYKKENAGVQGTGRSDFEPDFVLVNENLPATLNELVEVEIIEPEMAKQIEYKNKLIQLGHKDVIYADLRGWKESVGQDIIDSINAKKIKDLSSAEQSGIETMQRSQALGLELIQTGADATTIKNTLNQKLLPNKTETKLALVLNDGLPIENRFSGLRLRSIAQNTIKDGDRDPKLLTHKLSSAGVSDGLNKAVVDAVINKDLNIFDNYVHDKLTQNVEKENVELKKTIEDKIISEADLDQWIKDNPIEKSNDQKSNNEISYRNALDELNALTEQDPNSKSFILARNKEFGKDISKHPENVVQDWTNEWEKNNTDKSYATRIQKAQKKVNKFAKKLGLDQDPVVEKKEVTPVKEIIDPVPVVEENEIIPNPHKDISLLKLSDQQKAERKAYNTIKKEMTHQIFTNGRELKDGVLIHERFDPITLDETSKSIASDIWNEKVKQEDTKNRYVNYELIKDIDKDITYEEGYQAHQGTSFSPEQRAKTEIESHISTLTDDYEVLLKYADTPEKLEVFNKEFARYRAGLVKRKKDILSRKSRTVSAMISGPANYPRARMNKLYGYVDNATDQYIQYREKVIRSIKNKLTDSGIIKSDDVDAISKLETKVSLLEKNQEIMKKANAIMRSKKDDPSTKISKLKDLGLNESMTQDVKKYGGFQTFQLTNNNAKIKSAKQRLVKLKREDLEAKTLKESGEIKSTDYIGASVVENLEAKRVQVLFDDIPSVEIRTDLKKNGFKWSPKNKAWQRSLTEQSKWKATNVLDNHFAKKVGDDVAAKFDDAVVKKYTDEVDQETKFNNAIKNLGEC